MFEFMYKNESNKLDYTTRLKIVTACNYGTSKGKIAKRFGVSRQTVNAILKKYLVDGVYGLEDHKTGPLKEPLNPVFYANVVTLRQAKGWGACHIEKYFKKKGFSVNHNKIHEIIIMEDMIHNKKLGKRKRPKYIRYEAENINDQWHADWSIDPLTKKKLFAVIDDKSRFIVFAGLFDSASAHNTVIGLERAIARYGAPKELVTDNGSHFKNINKKVANEPLLDLEKKNNIKHIFIRAGYPQSNGKIERWFGSYKIEFQRMNYEKVTDCMTWVTYYNFERLHQSLNYETPAHVYLGVNSI
jgi:putative transposase